MGAFVFFTASYDRTKVQTLDGSCVRWVLANITAATIRAAPNLIPRPFTPFQTTGSSFG
ncbi:MAG TPA: hypothetical protein VKU01_12750 [Bryobacteraceae bacterium]|nr:hypothetical protein [Bryobacteraceae bacterium]